MKSSELKNKIQEIFEGIQENPLFQALSEKYQELDERQKKILKIFLSLLALFVFCLIPYSYFNSSLDLEKEFQEDISMMKSLNEIKMNQNSNTKSEKTDSYTPNSLKEQIRQKLSLAGLLPHQTQMIHSESAPMESMYKDLKLNETRLIVKVIKLNFRQIIRLANYIENLSPQVSVSNLSIQKDPEEEKEYFNVNYTVSLFEE